MFHNKLIYVVIALIIITIVILWQIFAYKVPEPKYKVLEHDGKIEIREYPAIIIAEVKIEGERNTAINNGFRILADYIFGNNISNQKIAMTAPVIQQGTKIGMTAPVSQQYSQQGWIIRFVMPANFTLKTLPKPTSNKITLIEMPIKKYVVIRFSGTSLKSNLSEHEELLRTYISKHHLSTTGEPIFAFYNPPWILPFLRRNEIMLEISQ